MSEGTSQTKISVKKSDGTVVRMTLAEFKEYKKQLTNNTPTVSQSVTDSETTTPVLPPVTVVEEQKMSDTPIEPSLISPVSPPASQPTQELVAITHQELATTTPVADLFVNEARAKMWNSDDHTSLLDEELADNDVKIKDAEIPQLPSRNSALLTAVMAALPFPVPEQVTGRLQSLIESRVKDVRTDDDVLAYGTRPAVDGGLGLSPEDAATLLETIVDTLNLPPSQTSITPSEEVVPDDLVSDAVESSDPIEEVAVSEEPQSKEKKSTGFSYDQSRDEIPWQPRFSPDAARQPTSAIPMTSEGRPLVHDVQAPSQSNVRTMGPVDEFRAFTLTDLHRLGNTKEKMTTSMVDKFIVLRDDSFVLYLDAIDAFRQSPLYRQYQEHILTSINESISLQTSLDYDEEGMTLNDVECIVNTMKAVGY